jgi:hypothetical protein
LKTLKITVVATIATTLAWWVRLPHRIWPEHPFLCLFLVALVLGIVLQVAWPDSKSDSEK